MWGWWQCQWWSAPMWVIGDAVGMLFPPLFLFSGLLRTLSHELCPAPNFLHVSPWISISSKNLWPLHLTLDLKTWRLIFNCNTTWPHYKLDNDSFWLENGTIASTIMQNLHKFCHYSSKWAELPNVQAFSFLYSCLSLCQSWSCTGPPCPPSLNPFTSQF